VRETVKAETLGAGDWINHDGLEVELCTRRRTPDGALEFTVGARKSKQATTITLDPAETVTVTARWPRLPWEPAR
jgi:hypothetical protein